MALLTGKAHVVRVGIGGYRFDCRQIFQVWDIIGRSLVVDAEEDSFQENYVKNNG